jgi:hypothetical protein
MMKRSTILIFLGLLLFSSLAVSAMAYSIEGGLAARGLSLIDTVLANKIPGCGNCIELKPTQDNPSEFLAGKIPGCGNCAKLESAKITPTEGLMARAAGCASCEDEGDDES